MKNLYSKKKKLYSWQTSIAVRCEYHLKGSSLVWVAFESYVVYSQVWIAFEGYSGQVWVAFIMYSSLVKVAFER